MDFFQRCSLFFLIMPLSKIPKLKTPSKNKLQIPGNFYFKKSGTKIILRYNVSKISFVFRSSQILIGVWDFGRGKRWTNRLWKCLVNTYILQKLKIVNARSKIVWPHCSHAYSISYFVLMILYDLKKENDDSFLLSARFIDYIAIRAPFFWILNSKVPKRFSAKKNNNKKGSITKSRR